MRWIESNDGSLVNLEQVCGVYIIESMFDDEPEEYSVVYLFHGGSVVDEHFNTRTEAEERLKYLIDLLGVDDQLEKAAKMLRDTFLSELKELTEE
ncbi:hypothetical protein [uncultured Ruminococcus sp.]|uniref:hypothetical protein n=1 Tax=uncultured Ruminococcus sp. TaxID=165186 RepID=UPI0025E09591|nr:hypothetical protein [uncultured Ruminococcus sp.]